jgi:mannan endo-1,4-beta-mannosidase
MVTTAGKHGRGTEKFNRGSTRIFAVQNEKKDPASVLIARIRVHLRPSLAVALSLLCGSAVAAEVHFLVQPGEIIGPISPYVYGLNEKAPQELGATVRRLGGNRATGYNWETNASSAGADWHHFSDNWFCADNFKYPDCASPGAMLRQFTEENRGAGLDSLITLQMAGYVAADMLGAVKEEEKAPSKRWVKASFHKKKPYTLEPDPKDGVVHIDEMVNFLVTKFGKAEAGGVKFYALDNEPALWASTHARIHPKKAGYWELLNRSEAAAYNTLRVDPTARILGPVLYGWQAFLNLQEAPDHAELNKEFGTFLDFYLQQMKELEDRHGKRLLHALDLHWYPEAQGAGKRITTGDTSPGSVEARLQAPRSLWDPGYVEQSWITQWSTKGKPIHLIPWVKEIIARRYPGTGLAFTEYDFGAGDHVSGGLAHADVLGIFGKHGVLMSNYWGHLKPYNEAAFRLYRNYDGQGGAFGDTAVSAATEDVARTSFYASVDPERPDLLFLVLLNKDQKETLRAKVEVQGSRSYATYECFGFGPGSPQIAPLPGGKFRKGGKRFDPTLPPLTAALIVCR